MAEDGCKSKFTNQADMIAEFRKALIAELEFIKRSPLASLIIINGHKVEGYKKGFAYRFYIDYAGTIPSDTPCGLVIDKNRYFATVISYDEDYITIECKDDLGDFIGKAQLESGTTALLEKLISRLDENKEKNNPAGLRMFNVEPYKKIYDYSNLKSNDELDEEQKAAFNNAINGNITYIWGPPGTGKTRVIGNIISALYTEGRSVLLVSHTNVAVNQAIKNAYERLEKIGKSKEYPILRLGNYDLNFRELKEDVTLDFHIKLKTEELIKLRDKLEKEEQEYLSNINDLKKEKEQFEWMREFPKIKETIEKTEYEKNELMNEKQEITKQDIVNSKKLEKLENDLHKCEPYFLLIEDLEKKKSELTTLKDRKEFIERSTSEAVNRIEQDENQIVLYHKREYLSKEKQKHISVSAQETRIENVNSTIKQYLNEKEITEEKILNLNDELSKSISKSRIGRAFSGLNDPIQIQIKLNELKSILQNLDREISANKQMIEDYEEELIHTKRLNAEFDNISVLSTPDTLNIEISSLKDKIANKSAEVNRVNNNINQLEQEINELNQQSDLLLKSLNCPPFAVKKTYGEKCEIRNQLKSRLYEIEKDLKEKEKIFREESGKYFDLFGDEIDFINFNESFFVMGKMHSSLVELFKNKTDKDIDEEIKKSERRLKDILTKIKEINTKINDVTQQIIAEIPIVGTTLTKAYFEDGIQNRKFDTVILDEASIAPIPALWCTAYLAENNIIIVGDFKQLAPIVINNRDNTAKEWLGNDIFKQSGIRCLHEKGKAPKHFIQLVNQRRMEKEIADLASELYYDSKIKTSLKPEDYRIKDKNNFMEWYGGSPNKPSINIIDTKELHAWVTGIKQGEGKTRLNCLSASLCVDLAFNLTRKLLKKKEVEETDKADDNETDKTDKTKVLILSPYSAHSKRIRELIKHECETWDNGKSIINYENFNLIKAGTIHSFQGNEADIVIFDLVVDEPHWSNNLFMDKPEELVDDLKRMFNVAITRAKFKLFIIGNIDYCKKGTKKEQPLGQLLEKLKEVPLHDAKKLFPNLQSIDFSPSLINNEIDGKHIICTQEHYYDLLETDLKRANKQILIFSPFITEDRLSRTLPFLQSAKKKEIDIYIITKPINEHPAKMQAQNRKCQQIITKNGFNIICKKMMHEKLVLIDEDIIWTGSLNTLSFSNTQEVMERRQNKEIFNEFVKQMNIENLIHVGSNEIEKTCPACNSEMFAAESLKGGTYWTCSNCDYSRDTSEAYPFNGEIVCEKCKATLIFSMTKQPRWNCTADKNHYRYVKRSDLKLPKMLDKIPAEKQIKVINYLLNRPKSKTSDTESIIRINETERAILAGSYIRKYKENGQLIAGYMSIEEAAEDSEVSENSITKALRGEQHRAGKFQWRTRDTDINASDIEPVKIEQTSEAKPILKIDSDGNTIGRYTSIAMAEKETGVNRTSIKSVLRGSQKTAGGFFWAQDK